MNLVPSGSVKIIPSWMILKPLPTRESSVRNTREEPDTHDKLAVFYLDGDKFGEIGRKMWASKDPVSAFREWSERTSRAPPLAVQRIAGPALGQ